MATLEPNVVNEPKEMETPTFYKKDIEKIVKDYLTKNPQIIDEVLASRSLEETIESYPDAYEILEKDGEEHELTPEIYAFIEKCVKAGKLRDGEYCLNLNFFEIDDGKILSACFGCETATTDDTHNYLGLHYEIAIYEDTYKVIYSEA